MKPEDFPQEHSGWVGGFTRSQADGAIPNGTTVIKVYNEVEGETPIGLAGIVLGSIAVTDEDRQRLDNDVVRRSTHFYFVEWRHAPRHAVGMMGAKIEEAPGGREGSADALLGRRLLEDGRELVLYRMIFNLRLCLGAPEDMRYDQGWCFHDIAAAYAGFLTWDGAGDPAGFFKRVGEDPPEYRHESA